MLALSLALPSSRPPVGGGGSPPSNITPPSISGGNLPEITTIDFTGSTGDEYENAAQIIEISRDGERVLLWFNPFSGSAPDPGLPDGIDANIAINLPEWIGLDPEIPTPPEDIASATAAALNGQGWSAVAVGVVVTLTDSVAGARVDADTDTTASIVVTVTQQGVTGVPVGTTLTRTEGVWTGADTITGIWQHDQGTGTWVDIAGETGATYGVQAIYATENIRYYETATNGAGSASEPSNELGPVSYPFALLDSVSAGSANNSNVTTGGIDTTGTTLIVAAVGSYPPLAAGDFSDSEGNTWTSLTLRTPASGVGLQLFYCINPDTSAAHTFSSTVASSYPSVAVLAFSGNPSYEQENGAVSASGLTLQPGSVTPGENDSLVVVGLSFNFAGATASIDGGYALPEQVAPVNGQCVGVAIGYKIQSVAAATNPTFTVTDETVERLAAGITVFTP